VVKLFNAPGVGVNTDQHTVPFGVNKALTVVGGIWFFSTPQGDGGWVRFSNGSFETMNPGSSVSGTCCWSVNGVSNNGYLSGTAFYHDFVSAWFKSGGGRRLLSPDWRYQRHGGKQQCRCHWLAGGREGLLC